MSTKVLLGGAALAGATYYVYQQRLEQTGQVKSQGLSLPSFGSSSTPTGGAGERTGRQLDEAALNAKEKLSDLHVDATKKIDTGLSKLEKERSKLTNWTSEKLDDLSNSLDSTSQEAKDRADALYQQAHRDDPKGLKKLGLEVKQTAIDVKNETEDRLGSAKDSVVGGVSSIKNSIVGGKNRAESELNRAADEAKAKSSSWFSSASDKTDQVAKDSQKALRGWGETAEQNADAYHDSLHSSTRSNGGGLFGWGSKRDTEESINAAYDEAQRIYNDAQKRVASTKKSWFSWGKDENKERLHAEAQRQLDAAKSQLDSASSKLNDWKEQAKQALQTNNTNTRSNAFYHWLRGGSPIEEERLARTARSSVRGWGDSVETFAQDELDDVSSRFQTPGSSKLNSWDRWANKKYDSTAKGAQDYFNDAQEAFNDAQKQVSDSAGSWWSWGSKKSNEVNAEAKKNLEEAQQRLSQASDNLSKWTSDTAKDLNSKFWSGADDAIHETKKGINSLNQKTLDGLDDAQKWVKDKK